MKSSAGYCLIIEEGKQLQKILKNLLGRRGHTGDGSETNASQIPPLLISPKPSLSMSSIFLNRIYSNNRLSFFKLYFRDSISG